MDSGGSDGYIVFFPSSSIIFDIRFDFIIERFVPAQIESISQKSKQRFRGIHFLHYGGHS